jgi:hypothetical protein
MLNKILILEPEHSNNSLKRQFLDYLSNLRSMGMDATAIQRLVSRDCVSLSNNYSLSYDTLQALTLGYLQAMRDDPRNL